MFRFLGFVSAGLEVGVYTDIAAFTTNLIGSFSQNADECPFQVEQSYEFRLGAAAGASVIAGPYTWNPNPETQTLIFSTAVADICVPGGGGGGGATPPPPGGGPLPERGGPNKM